jgi:hypothetical protein
VCIVLQNTKQSNANAAGQSRAYKEGNESERLRYEDELRAAKAFEAVSWISGVAAGASLALGAGFILFSPSSPSTSGRGPNVRSVGFAPAVRGTGLSVVGTF